MGQPSDDRAHPKVSTVIPCWNGAAYLEEAIRSVMAQNHPSLEIVVADDGSTDGSLELARGFGDPVRVIAGGHEGAAAARNRGVGEAHGDLLAFLDADDLWTDGRLALQLAVLEAE